MRTPALYSRLNSLRSEAQWRARVGSNEEPRSASNRDPASSRMTVHVPEHGKSPGNGPYDAGEAARTIPPRRIKTVLSEGSVRVFCAMTLWPLADVNVIAQGNDGAP
jgi:hypothetical protein